MNDVKGNLHSPDEGQVTKLKLIAFMLWQEQ